MWGLFFDLDGTLVDSERLHWESWRAALHVYDLNLSWSCYREEAIGRTDSEILRCVINRASLRLHHADEERILSEKKRRFHRLATSKTPIAPQTIQLLQSLSSFKIALVTSSTRFEALGMLDGADVIKCFSAIVCLDDVARPKPDPEPYLLAMEQLDVKRGIAFEDSRAGQASAAAAGLRVVAVSTPRDLASLVESALTTRPAVERHVVVPHVGEFSSLGIGS